MQNHAVISRKYAAYRAHRGARRVGTMHASHGHGSLSRLAVVDRDHPPAVDAPPNFVLILASSHAGIAVDAAIGVAEKFHSRHGFLLTPFLFDRASPWVLACRWPDRIHKS